MNEFPEITVDISKDDISYLVTVSCESLDRKVTKRFESVSNMSEAVEEAKKSIGLDYKNH